MAAVDATFHSGTIHQLQKRLGTAIVGENIQCGDAIRSIHADTMKRRQHANRVNRLSRNFHEFGMGTCKSQDEGSSILFMCQLFQDDRSSN
jgi:hypothetical protein